MLKELLTKKIIELIESKNLTQQEIGDLTGLHRSYISNLKNGREFLNLTRIEEICQKLGYPVQQFIREAAQEIDKPYILQIQSLGCGVAESEPSHTKRQADQVRGLTEFNRRVVELPKEKQLEVMHLALSTLSLAEEPIKAKKKSK